MASIALLANLAMIGGHFSDMVKVFVYPAIGYIHRRIRQNRSLRDPRMLAGEDLERCHEHLKHTLDDLEVMTEEGFGSSKECKRMEELALEHEVLGREVIVLGDGLWGKRSIRPSKECLQDIATLADSVKLFQSKVQIFTNEKKLGRIKQLAKHSSESQDRLKDANDIQTIIVPLPQRSTPSSPARMHSPLVDQVVESSSYSHQVEECSSSEPDPCAVEASYSRCIEVATSSYDQKSPSISEEERDSGQAEQEEEEAMAIKVSTWRTTRHPRNKSYGPTHR
ncbi:hypothetical protein AAF712_004494 [Marasmius tenuissimus]|uniref:Uncharacterized protein n=1 Tax=Marasmius tenuissimus TaxID=585030 RepID=A0ABR3A4Z9_9AGAR